LITLTRKKQNFKLFNCFGPLMINIKPKQQPATSVKYASDSIYLEPQQALVWEPMGLGVWLVMDGWIYKRYILRIKKHCNFEIGIQKRGRHDTRALMKYLIPSF
jgi:hypothetical protein